MKYQVGTLVFVGYIFDYSHFKAYDVIHSIDSNEWQE